MANVFTNETRLKALWRFENGALTTDSKGTNTLVASASPPVVDTVDYKEGSACVDFERDNSQFYKITDANLGAGFPLKSGDTTKRIAGTLFFKQESTGTSWLVSKYDSSNNKRCWGIYLNSSAGLGIYFGCSDGILQELKTTTLVLTNGRWYHLGFFIDGIAKTCHVRVYDYTTTTIVLDYTFTFTNELSITTADFCIGAKANPSEYWDGKIDEVCIFNAEISSDEIDRIRAGTFTPESHVEQVTAQAAWTEAAAIRAEQVTAQAAWTETPSLKIGGVLAEVVYEIAPIVKIAQTLLQVEVVRAATGAYVSQCLAQVEWNVLTNIEVDVDTIPIEIVPLSPTLRLTEHLGAVNIAIEALTMFPPGFGVSVSTENIAITPKNISVAYGINVSTTTIEILLLAVTVELIAKRKFPVPPSFRELQSQPYKRKFPVGH